jgi:hypothetical protein
MSIIFDEVFKLHLLWVMMVVRAGLLDSDTNLGANRLKQFHRLPDVITLLLSRLSEFTLVRSIGYT